MDQTTYIGPYLKVDKVSIKPIEKEKKENLFTCTNKSCKIHGKKAIGRFCSECGSKNDNTSITRKVVEVPNGYQILYDFGSEDLLSMVPDIKDIIFLPNRRNDYSFQVDSDNSFLEKEINKTPEYLNSLFYKDYEDFLKFLDSKDITYQIKFGVITYWS